MQNVRLTTKVTLTSIWYSHGRCERVKRSHTNVPEFLDIDEFLQSLTILMAPIAGSLWHVRYLTPSSMSRTDFVRIVCNLNLWCCPQSADKADRKRRFWHVSHRNTTRIELSPKCCRYRGDRLCRLSRHNLERPAGQAFGIQPPDKSSLRGKTDIVPHSAVHHSNCLQASRFLECPPTQRVTNP